MLNPLVKEQSSLVLQPGDVFFPLKGSDEFQFKYTLESPVEQSGHLGGSLREETTQLDLGLFNSPPVDEMESVVPLGVRGGLLGLD